MILRMGSTKLRTWTVPTAAATLHEQFQLGLYYTKLSPTRQKWGKSGKGLWGHDRHMVVTER
jgi:hypothetical protein